MQVFQREGVFVPDFDLWLDPHQTRAVAWVTHAHADHMRRHKRVFSTRATAAMMQARGATSTRFHSLKWGEQWDWNGAAVSLHPAGHVLGSSQILVEARDGTKLLYSGDFKLAKGLSCEEIQIPRADILVMETTFGRPKYQFPSIDKVISDICAWCAECLGKGETPVLFCYSLGKGQEVLAGLQNCGFPIHLQAAHARICAVYDSLGVRFPKFSTFQNGSSIEGVLLCASQCRRSAWWPELERTHRLKTAYISGWALDGIWNARARFGTDAAFALSDHAGYADLLEYVRISGAQTVWTTHGFEKEFAADLRALGLNAAPLREASTRAFGQLALEF